MHTLRCVSVVMVALLAGCATRLHRPVEGFAPRDIDQLRAVEIARGAIAANDDWVERATFDARQREDGWAVYVVRHPEVIGGDRLVIIDGEGRVTDYIRGQ